MNAHRDEWMQLLVGDPAISANMKDVAKVLADSVGIGRVAFTNWQNVNRELGKETRDASIFVHIRGLQRAGYLGRFMGNAYNQSRGWPLLIPASEVDAHLRAAG